MNKEKKYENNAEEYITLMGMKLKKGDLNINDNTFAEKPTLMELFRKYGRKITIKKPE